jgi:hypothetical protein
MVDTDNIDVIPAVIHDDGNISDGNDTAPWAGQIAGARVTNINLRVEQNKIPEFFGLEGKDTISAMDFIRRLEDLAKTNRWTDAQTYYHFANLLQIPACKWLLSMVDMENE